MPRVIPLQDRVYVEKLAEGSRTEGGIIIPENMQQYQIGVVILRVGCNVKDKRLKKGANILIQYNPTIEVSKDHYLLSEDECLALLEKTEDEQNNT
jgi:co-chaperonin GroES (HSP10)